MGYDSFDDLKSDLYYHEKESLFPSIPAKTFQNTTEYINCFLNIDKNLTIFFTSNINLNMIQDLAKDISQSKLVLFLVADYNMNIVSIFSEILFLHHIIFTTINRENSDQAILQACKHTDVIIVSSLSFDWISKRKQLISQINKPFYIITTKIHDHPNTIYLTKPIEFNSFYETQKYLTTVFLLIDYYLNSENL